MDAFQFYREMTKSTSDYLVRPRIGVVGPAFPGYQLGAELSAGKFREALNYLSSLPVEVVAGSKIVTDNSQAGEIGDEFSQANVDGILAVALTFIPDHFIVGLLDQCNMPIFLWCVERDLKCLATVCGPMITATSRNGTGTTAGRYSMSVSSLDEAKRIMDQILTYKAPC